MFALQVPLTDEALLEIGRANPGWRVERYGGSLLVSPPTGGRTGRRNARLAHDLEEFAEAHGYASFDSSTGFSLPNGDLLSPDASLVALEEWERLSADRQEGMVPLVPAVVVELRSMTDRRASAIAKCETWFAEGVGYVVFVDPYDNDVRTWGDAPDGFPDLSTLG